MAVHDAMVDRMDQGIGELIDALEKNNQLDNTLILFLSDNGCSSEVCQNYSEGENDRPDMTRIGEKIIYPRKKEVLPGSELSYASIGPIWANVANTPFRFWKAKSYEGGINTPLIAFWPKGINKGKGGITNQPSLAIRAFSLKCSKPKYSCPFLLLPFKIGTRLLPSNGRIELP